MVWARVTGGFLVLVGVCGLPFWYKAARSVEYRNLRVVEPGVLYRSGQLTPAGFDRVFREQGIRTVVALREAGRDDDDKTEMALCERYGIAHVRMPQADWIPDGTGVSPGDRNVQRFIQLLADPDTKFPILVHCFAGIHRTGPYCAVYRMEKQNWTPDEALAEVWAMGTARTTFSDDLLGYLRAYRPGRLRAAVAARGR
jgi:protein tyrosine/serine phosphatase